MRSLTAESVRFEMLFFIRPYWLFFQARLVISQVSLLAYRLVQRRSLLLGFRLSVLVFYFGVLCSSGGGTFKPMGASLSLSVLISGFIAPFIVLVQLFLCVHWHGRNVPRNGQPFGQEGRSAGKPAPRPLPPTLACTNNMADTQKSLPEHVDVMFRIKRGLCGYVSYLAACDMNEAFSEYVLYEPILRIMNAKGFKVECEYECPGIEQPTRGDKKRLDFFAIGRKSKIALEVKWVTSSTPNLTRDLEKLRAVRKYDESISCLLCVFGRRSNLEKINLRKDGLGERGTAVYADFRKTKFGCRVFGLG